MKSMIAQAGRTGIVAETTHKFFMQFVFRDHMFPLYTRPRDRKTRILLKPKSASNYVALKCLNIVLRSTMKIVLCDPNSSLFMIRRPTTRLRAGESDCESITDIDDEAIENELGAGEVNP